MTGQVSDTDVAALQGDGDPVPGDARLVGVVRKPAPWFHAAVDENRPALGPPADLLERVQAKREGLKVQGMCEAGAHNAAWEETDFPDRYREHLRSDDAREALAELRHRLASGEDIALVCYENTDRKRCHRTILRDVLAD